MKAASEWASERMVQLCLMCQFHMIHTQSGLVIGNCKWFLDQRIVFVTILDLLPRHFVLNLVGEILNLCGGIENDDFLCKRIVDNVMSPL